MTCKVGGPKKKRRVTCTVQYAKAESKKRMASWRLAAGKRTAGKGRAVVRKGKATIKAGGKRGLGAGRYKLKVTLKIPGRKAVVLTKTIRVR
jgi:hypothetical protein